MKISWILIVIVSFVACNKPRLEPQLIVQQEEQTESARGGPPKTKYTTYTIRQGQHYCDQNTLKAVTTSEMNFVAKFDNSAIYQTILPDNQYDINKLWGFSEGFDHQYNSARIGWSWNNDALRLYAYAYANGIRYSEEITPVLIGTDINCSIRPVGNTYVFSVNGISVSLPRGPSTSTASGYQLYPYFGGDETAPHTITILIRSLR